MIYAALALGVLFLFVGNEVSSMSDKPNYDDLFKKYGSRYGIDWKLLKAIAIIESSLGEHPTVKRGLADPNDIEGSKSTDGKSWGLMQVTLPTARDYDQSATAVKLNNPDYSVDIAARHVRFLMGLFDKKSPNFLEYVIKSYNQGQGNTKQGKTFADPYWAKYQRAYGSIA